MHDELSIESKKKILNKRMKFLRKALRRNKRSQVVQRSKGLAIDNTTKFGALVLAYLDSSKNRQQGIPTRREFVRHTPYVKKTTPATP